MICNNEKTVCTILDDYILNHDLRDSSVDYYRRVVNVFCNWAGKRVPDADFTPTLVSQFLLEKQQAGKSWPYRKSLRSGLRALLGHVGRDGKLRPVKADPLEPEAWTQEEVGRLLAAVEKLPEGERQYWREIIQVAYYSGLSQCDIFRLTRTHVQADGTIRTRRSKTGTQVLTAIPAALADAALSRRHNASLWPLRTSREWFRRRFAKIVKIAKLSGSFKRLRNSSGTSVEMIHPGRGHEHLGNTRKVFEMHYCAAWGKRQEPMQPAAIVPPGAKPALVAEKLRN